MLLLLTRPADLSHSKFTSDLCDGHVLFVFFSQSYQNTEQLIKSRKREKKKKKQPKSLKDIQSSLDLSEHIFRNLFVFVDLLIIFRPLDFQMLSLIENRWIAGQ